MSETQNTRAKVVSGHLDYYLQHKINPVRYNISDRRSHFERRASLYRSLHVHPLTLRKARVLEVAAGSGQNSLYIASLGPRHYTLVEPNPVGMRDIESLYCEPEFARFRPELFHGKFEDFAAPEPYEIVVCENWLGQGAHERALLRKLGGLVVPEGLLVLTTLTALGALPNVLRKLLALRLGCWAQTFDECTKMLNEAFASHLNTISDMTRSCTDWIHDNLMNPHYYNNFLTVPMVAEDLGADFTFLGSSPSFAQDWRWFKSLYGAARDFNGHFLAEYYANCHNFLDFRRILPRGDSTGNRALDDAAWRLLETAREVDYSVRTGEAGRHDADPSVLARLRDVMATVEVCGKEHVAALKEFEQLYCSPRLSVEQVREMDAFRSLFGRETIYVSLQKN